MNTSVIHVFQQANVLLGMSAICRKDEHVGRGDKNLILQVIAHPFRNEAMRVTYWPDCSHPLPGRSQEQVATPGEGHVGTCFCDSRKGKGAEAAAREEESC